MSTLLELVQAREAATAKYWDSYFAARTPDGFGVSLTPQEVDALPEIAALKRAIEALDLDIQAARKRVTAEDRQHAMKEIAVKVEYAKALLEQCATIATKNDVVFYWEMPGPDGREVKGMGGTFHPFAEKNPHHSEWDADAGWAPSAGSC